MIKKYIRFLIGILIALLFLWLAVKDISFSDFRLTMNKLTYYWLIPYVVISLLSHYLRAERWKQLIEQEGMKTSRWTLFSGVMLGYLVNYAVPRLGEVSRSVYVGNRERISRTKLVGTVVLERVMDLAVMFVLVLFVFIYLFTDYSVIVPILGAETVRWLQAVWSLDGILVIGLLLLSILVVLFLIYQLLRIAGRWLPAVFRLLQLAAELSKKFAQGLISFRDVKNWPLFIILTTAIWFCYVLMTYIPFTAFDMHSEFGLGMQEALVITVVSALGVSLPSPGGIGTYHWFVSRSLLFFFAVPEVIGVTYAIVTHLIMMIIILVATPVILVVNKAMERRNIESK